MKRFRWRTFADKLKRNDVENFFTFLGCIKIWLFILAEPKQIQGGHAKKKVQAQVQLKFWNFRGTLAFFRVITW